MPIGYWESEHLLAPADLTVIGAGIVGMSTALHYKAQTPCSTGAHSRARYVWEKAARRGMRALPALADPANGSTTSKPLEHQDGSI